MAPPNTSTSATHPVEPTATTATTWPPIDSTAGEVGGSPPIETSDGAAAQAGDAGQRAAVRPVVVARGLTKTYVLGQTRVRALRGVNLDVAAGEFVAIMGPSGSGKSTFMNLLGCLDRPTSGEYWLAGTPVSRMSADALADVRNRRIGFVFQGFNLLSRATALENVMLPLMYAGMEQHQQMRRARRALELVGLAGRANHRPNQLSGGQQQRVAIARALVNGPALLLADEPTGNLDSQTSLEVMAVLQTLNQHGLTIVLVTHEADIAAYTARQIAFRDGRVLSDTRVPSRSALEDLARVRAANQEQASAAEGEPPESTPQAPSTTQMSPLRPLRATGSLRSSSPSGSVQIKEEPR